MSQRTQIPVIQGVRDPVVSRILVPMKEIVDEITGRSLNRPLINELGPDASLAGVINKINEIIARLQNNDFHPQIIPED